MIIIKSTASKQAWGCRELIKYNRPLMTSITQKSSPHRSLEVVFMLKMCGEGREEACGCTTTSAGLQRHLEVVLVSILFTAACLLLRAAN